MQRQNPQTFGGQKSLECPVEFSAPLSYSAALIDHELTVRLHAGHECGTEGVFGEYHNREIPHHPHKAVLEHHTGSRMSNV